MAVAAGIRLPGRPTRGSIRGRRAASSAGPWRCVAALAAALLAFPALAQAHGEDSADIRTVLVRSSPELAGVSIRTVSSTATALELVNRTPRDVEVLSDRGVPFLRIGPRGVEGNVNANEFYASGNPDGAFDPPREARIGGPPRWERISRNPGWTWFEHRLHPTDVVVPPELRQGRERRRLGDWRVPLRVAGRPAGIEGYVEYRPLLGQVVPAFTGPSMPAQGVVAAILPGPIPGIFLDTTATRERVTVLGAAGEPFLRFGPRGVEANLRSPTHQSDQRVRGQRPSVEADPRAAPRWREVAEDARYTWLESRARYPREQPPDPVVDGGRRRTLLDWRVPLEVGDERAELRGATSWIPTVTGPVETPAPPPPGGGVSGVSVGVLAGLTALALGGAAYVGRRRRTAAG